MSFIFNGNDHKEEGFNYIHNMTQLYTITKINIMFCKKKKNHISISASKEPFFLCMRFDKSNANTHETNGRSKVS